jgi:hypothetical protein
VAEEKCRVRVFLRGRTVDDLGQVSSKLFIFVGTRLHVGPRTASIKNRLKGGHSGGSFAETMTRPGGESANSPRKWDGWRQPEAS